MRPSDMVAYSTAGLWRESLQMHKATCLKRWNSIVEQTTEAHTHANINCAAHGQCRSAAARTSCHSSNYLAVVCQWIPPSRVLHTLTLPFLWGVTIVQLLGGGGRVRMQLTSAEAVQQKCKHLIVCMSVKWMGQFIHTSKHVCVSACVIIVYRSSTSNRWVFSQVKSAFIVL